MTYFGLFGAPGLGLNNYQDLVKVFLKHMIRWLYQEYETRLLNTGNDLDPYGRGFLLLFLGGGVSYFGVSVEDCKSLLLGASKRKSTLLGQFIQKKEQSETRLPNAVERQAS